jgi:hypothetical protein
MDATTLADSLRDDFETELSRLGSSKWLYALTDGDMTGDAIRAAAAADAAAVAARFESWADAADPDVADAFAALADAAADRRETADPDAVPADSPVYAALDDAGTTDERLGAALGYLLVLDRTVGQMVGFFVGDADPTTADTFRDLRSTVEANREAVEATLDDVCENWDAARDAASAVVEAAYDDYVDTLESLGVQPKNVC